MKTSAEKARRRLTLVLMASLLNSFCATLDRGDSRIIVSGSYNSNRVAHRTYGCDNELLTEQIHKQVGATGTVRFEHLRGFVAQAIVGQHHGELKSEKGFNPYKTSYDVTSLGGLIGWDFKYVGYELGWNASFGASVTHWPCLTFRVGNLEKVWFEVGGFHLSLPGSFIGFGYRSEMFKLNLGYGGSHRALEDLDEGGMKLGSPEDAGAYANVEILLTDNFGLKLGGFISYSFSIDLGLVFAF